MNNNTPHVKSQKKKRKKRTAALGRPAIKLITGGRGGGLQLQAEIAVASLKEGRLPELIIFQNLFKLAGRL